MTLLREEKEACDALPGVSIGEWHGRGEAGGGFYRALALLTGCNAATRGSVVGDKTDSVPEAASLHTARGPL